MTLISAPPFGMNHDEQAAFPKNRPAGLNPPDLDPWNSFLAKQAADRHTAKAGLVNDHTLSPSSRTSTGTAR